MVMLTLLLLSPPPVSHQYSPLSPGYTLSAEQEDPVGVLLISHSGSNSLLLLIALSWVKPPDPPQSKEIESNWKCCSLFGVIRRKAASETKKEMTVSPKKHSELEKYDAYDRLFADFLQDTFWYLLATWTFIHFKLNLSQNTTLIKTVGT